jgi:hypothetical protein
MKVDQKNVTNMNMSSICLFAYRIMSSADSHACYPNKNPGVFRTLTMVFSAPIKFEVAHP